MTVEVAPIYQDNTSAVTGVSIRDSKDPDGPILVFKTGEWTAFLTQAKLGNLEVAKLKPWGSEAPADVVLSAQRMPEVSPTNARPTYEGFRAPSSAFIKDVQA